MNHAAIAACQLDPGDSLNKILMKTNQTAHPLPSSVSGFPVGSREGSGLAVSSCPKNVVMFSGGIGSWAAGKRVAADHGTDGLVLLFTDVKMEDPDLYRFLHEAAANIGGELVIISEGRTPWQVFEDERYIGNSRVDPCSRVLKREILDKWRNANCHPERTTIHVGIDWTEKRGHKTTPLTLEQFRLLTEAGAHPEFNDDFAAGCGCAL